MDVSESHPLFPTYTKYPITLLKGEGSRVWDDQGKSILIACQVSWCAI